MRTLLPEIKDIERYVQDQGYDEKYDIGQSRKNRPIKGAKCRDEKDRSILIMLTNLFK